MDTIWPLISGVVLDQCWRPRVIGKSGRFGSAGAKQAITDLLLIYCRGIDRCDAALVKRAFWEDAYDNHGAHAAPAWQVAEEIVAAKLASTEWTTHAVTNHLVEVDGDAAFSEAIVLTFQKEIGGEVSSERPVATDLATRPW
jgi:hypothetical protein